GRDPHGGEIFCFRGRKADVVKLLWFDGVGVSLYAKRLEAGKFVWSGRRAPRARPLRYPRPSSAICSTMRRIRKQSSGLFSRRMTGEIRAGRKGL
ncbi:IS66 family insertion sequence element accessory protein TnpB, partial [Cereibacter sediminicola]|uniref:IS66 family insertion sequence element accessory protein TnpB n=1 Tax=Cereibacter sediminicola TaxID=2584941 RepID=UPI0011A6AA4A